jgi:hypothetical protein
VGADQEAAPTARAGRLPSRWLFGVGQASEFDADDRRDTGAEPGSFATNTNISDASLL